MLAVHSHPCFGLQAGHSSETTVHVFVSFSFILVVVNPERNTEKSEREKRENITEKFIENSKKQFKKIQRRGVSLDDPFSPYCEFNQ